jgi:Bacterial Ig domain
MTTDRVRRPGASSGVAQRGRRVGPPAVVLAVLALCAAFMPSDGPTPFALWSVDAAGQALPIISIGDAWVVEGNSGVQTMVFTMALDAASSQEVRVSYGTVTGVAGGSATAGLVTTLHQSAGVLTTIPDVGPASNYPITINVSGVTGPLQQFDLQISGLTHTSPADVDILLEAPNGQTAVVLSDAGGTTPAAKVVLNLRDDASALISTPLGSGPFLPYSGSPADTFPAPAPSGPYAEVGPDGATTLTDPFRGINPNGLWKVWIVDDTPGNQGSVGSFSLTLGVADATSDVVFVSGQKVFLPGTLTQQILLPVNGDTTVEPDETVLLDLYAAINGVVGRNQAVGTITNDDGGAGGLPPTSVNDAYQTVRDAPLQVPSPGVLANDMTNLGGPMSAQVVTPTTFGLLTLATDGSFKYIPGPNFTGTDSFTYRAVNTAGTGNVATVQITVMGGLPPTAHDDNYAYTNSLDGGFFGAGAGVLLRNDDDNGGGPMSAELVSAPASGGFNFDATGRFTYYPPDGFAGTATFTYRLKNQFGVSNTATVSIAITRGTRPPAPMNLRVDSVVGNRPVVRFDTPVVSPAATGYEIAGGTQPGETLAVIPTGSLYGIYSFIAPVGSFVLRALSVLGIERSNPSNEVALHMNTTVTPSAPENLLGLVDGSTLALAWKNTFGGGIPTNVILNVTGDFTGSLPLGQSETFSFAGVPSGTYTLSVRGANAGGSSPPSNSVTLTFPGACSGPPLTPQNFLLYVNRLTLGAIWDLPPSGPAPTSYALNVTSPVFVGQVPVGATHISADVPSGTYTVSVQASNSCGASAPTPAQTVVVQ